MPQLEVVDFIHYAVLWIITGRDRYVKPVLSSPVEIRCRWISTKKERVDAQGNTITIDAQVYVGRDILIGSLMWLGRLADLGVGQVPSSDVMQVVGFPKTPDLKGRNYRRMVNLMRYTDTLPSVEP